MMLSRIDTIKTRIRLGALFAVLCAQATLSACASSGSSHENPAARATGERAASYARKFVGTRYKYGGNSPRKGFDCSGLVQYTYKLAGINVPRTTRLQLQSSRHISRGELQSGDLLFFHQEGKRFSHVGIYIGNGRFVHAPSSGKRVRVSSLDNRYWERHLAATRRFSHFY